MCSSLFERPPTRIIGHLAGAPIPDLTDPRWHVRVLSWQKLAFINRSLGVPLLDQGPHLARTIHEYLLRRPIRRPEPLGGVPILSSGGAFLVRPPRRTASTPTLALLARSPGGLRSRTPRDGIHE